MLAKYGPAQIGEGRRSSMVALVRSLHAFLWFTLLGRLLGIYVPAGADDLERRAYEVEGLMDSLACTVLGEELLFFLLGAREEEEYLLCLPVCAIVSESRVQIFLVACWDSEYDDFYFEITRCHPLVDDVEVSIFDCATRALIDLYVDRWPPGSRGDNGDKRDAAEDGS